MIERKIGQHPSRTTDGFAVGHFCVWLLFGIVFYLGGELDRLFGLWLLLVPLLGLPALIASVAFAMGLVANLRARRWRRLASVIAAPVVTVGWLAASGYFQVTPDWIHFQLTRDHYEELARSVPGPSPKYQEWSWGGSGGASGPNTFYRLVYDETDKPLTRSEEPEHQGGRASARAYGEHFFLVTEVFQ
ncbi:hypothetical protein HX870_06560 [Pseudomonas gingeri]|uniref:hypothetical protein n=1 Tax=Pseudomonas gingeri TaxID=117681 RepID=UPI0015A41D90|nr:hypothetical protein [Pseudomonas gingeri]NWD67258.1 hypothetical protein [Pseudomonas gingeri]